MAANPQIGRVQLPKRGVCPLSEFDMSVGLPGVDLPWVDLPWVDLPWVDSGGAGAFAHASWGDVTGPRCERAKGVPMFTTSTIGDHGDGGGTPGRVRRPAGRRLLHQRIVVLGQQVDDPIANRICAQLLLLSAEDQRRDISLYINSPGGSVSAGLAIYDTMRLIPNDVSTLAMGIAASMGQFLLTAGTPGKRYALPHARILMHQGSAGIRGTAVDVADPGREPGVHQGFDEPADRRAHRPGAGDDRAGRRPRPLVHRRAGAATTGSSTGSCSRSPTFGRPPTASGSGWADHGPLHRPDRGREDPVGRAGRRRLSAGCCPIGSSTWAPRSTTTSRTSSSRSCCTWSRTTRTGRSRCTSTRPAARCRR